MSGLIVTQTGALGFSSRPLASLEGVLFLQFRQGIARVRFELFRLLHKRRQCGRVSPRHLNQPAVHEPFFDGVFRPLLDADGANEINYLSASLERFLSSERIGSRHG